MKNLFFIIIILFVTGCGRPVPQTTPAPQAINPTKAPPTVASYKPIEPEITKPPINELSPEEELLNSMSIEEKVGQLFIYAISGKNKTEFNEEIRAMIDRYKPGGVILFSENIDNAEQVKHLIQEIKAACEIPPFISVDEEGGTVVRVANISDVFIPSAAEIGLLGTDAALQYGKEIGKYLHYMGFNLNFAPVADVNTNPQNTVIGARAFGIEPEKTADMVEAMVKGISSQNILTTIKHFPGHGDTVEDSHYGMASIEHDMERLRSVEFIPFKRGIEAGADAVLVGHISLPEITGNSEPAIFSRYIITDILRNELNFEGIIVTDAMNMGAVTEYYSSSEAAVKAFEAGIDIILMPKDNDAAYYGILKACETNRISEERINESVLRILRAKKSMEDN